MQISYLGKVSVNDIFGCQMCGHKGREKYLATPEAVTLVDWREQGYQVLPAMTNINV